jgi:hypothetical protein
MFVPRTSLLTVRTLIAAALVSSAPAWPDDLVIPGFVGGNQLNELFTTNPDAAMTYVQGVADAFALLKTLRNRIEVCLPDKVTKQQLGDVVRKYLQDHPADRHTAASSLVLLALGEAFPCPK